LFSAWRWSAISNDIGAPLPFSGALKYFMISQFYNQALPSFVPGDAYRVWGSKRFGNVRLALLSVVLDRLVTLIALACWAGLDCVLLYFGYFAAKPPLWIAPLAGLLAACGVLFLLLLAAWRSCRPILPPRIAAHLVPMMEAFSKLLSRPKTALFFAVSLLIHAFSAASFYVLARGMHLSLTLGMVFAVVPLAMLAAVLPVSVNGWGLREGAMIALLGGFGIGVTQAVTLSITFGLWQLVLGLVGALFVLCPDNRTAAPPKRGEVGY
jgi:uncharacterized membrane protein YbhN (UPF0104 family)